MAALIESSLPFPKRQGKVRDVYDLGDRLLIVSSDRISAFDWILPTPIPDKGRLLTQMSLFWFEFLGVENHLLSAEVPEQVKPYDPQGVLEGRVMQVRKASVIPFECVVRGYLEGSGWRDYQTTGSICGVALPPGLLQCAQLQSPIFTPATKAETGHDENVGVDTMIASLGKDVAKQLQERSIAIYRKGADWARDRGVIIADTKFEFGWCDDRIILIDEVLTPDSSRFWPMDQYQPGKAQPSYDKQFVREHLMRTTWDRNSPPPELPDDVVEQTRAKYVEAYQRITGRTFL
ncbi:MAG: phosphoribosylaminoimidazolesuccinocarboxamide synthase [Pirellulales bacterium]